MCITKQPNMKQINKTFGYVVLIVGLALVFAGFFLLVPHDKRTDVFWLNFSKLYFNKAAYCGGFRGSIDF